MTANTISDRRRVLLRRVRWVLAVFMAALVASGLTAVPLQWELDVLARALAIPDGASPADYDGLRHWIALVREGLRESFGKYPFLAYGTDWLAFAHVMIAVAFVGPWRDPVRNRWVIEFGLIACAAVAPMALVFGPVRGIPVYWRLIDCSFGLLGAVPLWLARRWTLELERTAS